MNRQRIAEGEILMAIRNKGAATIEEVEAVVLATDGSFSAIKIRQAVRAPRYPMFLNSALSKLI
jgi:uncharacterized membrane protein YcaP (DUF421 family)